MITPTWLFLFLIMSVCVFYTQNKRNSEKIYVAVLKTFLTVLTLLLLVYSIIEKDTAAILFSSLVLIPSLILLKEGLVQIKKIKRKEPLTGNWWDEKLFKQKT